MNVWMVVWMVVLIIGILSFLCISLTVTIRGLAEVRGLLKEMLDVKGQRGSRGTG